MSKQVYVVVHCHPSGNGGMPVAVYTDADLAMDFVGNKAMDPTENAGAGYVIHKLWMNEGHKETK